MLLGIKRLNGTAAPNDFLLVPRKTTCRQSLERATCRSFYLAPPSFPIFQVNSVNLNARKLRAICSRCGAFDTARTAINTQQATRHLACERFNSCSNFCCKPISAVHFDCVRGSRIAAHERRNNCGGRCSSGGRQRIQGQK